METNKTSFYFVRLHMRLFYNHSNFYFWIERYYLCGRVVFFSFPLLCLLRSLRGNNVYLLSNSIDRMPIMPKSMNIKSIFDGWWNVSISVNIMFFCYSLFMWKWFNGIDNTLRVQKRKHFSIVPLTTWSYW